MKRRLYFLAIFSLASMCVIALSSGISHAGVLYSKHDLATADRATHPGGSQISFKTTQVCVFCHTPHGANDKVRSKTTINQGTTSYLNTTGSYAVTGNPLLLWNRDLANVASASQGYRVYTSSTLDATVNEVRAYSLLCMSCHDGVSAMNVMANPPEITDPGLEAADANGYPILDDTATTSMMNGLTGPNVYSNIGERKTLSDPVLLNNDHPISFDYTDAVASASGGLALPGTDGLVGTDNLRLFPNGSGNLVSMECSTCHDVHNYGTLTDRTQPFLAVSIKNSRLCCNCHLKCQ